ncbi:RrF2 family transcriptional regulator [Robertmurraya kyonggiensis]|uniref:Rrf2 family transcriptional regulator n=1 Tax=Robertmurraya kyonggiensis TaxID=1037680 RepID=A0A4U1D4K4_9BACI|nr:Rrf2 family transcriptional regulator [Robertmurraya kyonggiensis]TKC16157.1 Rrf2 family transcriptional regulator [Robertmurraya kyonggiensis]
MQEVARYGDIGPTWFNTAIKSLAILASTDELVSSNQLADELGVESSFIRKVLAKLIAENLVEGIGGRYGGYKIIADPTKTTIFNVYLALVKDSYIKEQRLIINKTDQLIAEIITEAEQQFSTVLNRYTIADIKKTITR